MSEAVPKTNIVIHPSAVVDENAVIGEGTEIGAFSYIGPNVILGSNNKIHSHVVIDGYTEIGDENTIFQFASVGAAPQDLKYKGEASKLSIGNRNIIREYVTLQPGTEGGGMLTSIQDSNLFMACTHVGHDCKVGSRNIFANSATVAGHVEIGDSVLVGGLVGIHQFVRIGSFAMVAAGSMVNKDIPPFLMCQGDRAMLIGVHQVGLERNRFEEDQIREIKNFYKDIFLSKSESFKERIDVKKKEVESFSDALREHLSYFCDFILASDRGIASVRKK